MIGCKAVLISKSESERFKRYLVRSLHDDEILGNIEWYPDWKRWVFYPASRTMFSSVCLSQLSQILSKLESDKEVK
jgi:hypothetical protein